MPRAFELCLILSVGFQKPLDGRLGFRQRFRRLINLIVRSLARFFRGNQLVSLNLDFALEIIDRSGSL
jgi:hypothetical protein